MSQCHDTYDQDPISGAHLPLLVRDIMTSPALTVSPSATVKEITALLLQHQIRSVPVVDSGDAVVGMVSELDLICQDCWPHRHPLTTAVQHLLHHEPGSDDDVVRAEDVMTKDIVYCIPTDPASVAARRMLSGHIVAMPVEEDGRIVGVISRHDVLKIFDRPDTEITARIEAILNDPSWFPNAHNVTVDVKGGIVHLSGTVCYPSDARVLVSRVTGVPGVINIRNELTAEDTEPAHLHIREDF